MMSSQNPAQVVYGPNVAQVKPMIQQVPISPRVTILPLQASSTSEQKSQLCGQGVAPGRYRYNTASMNGKQGILMFPIGSQDDVKKRTFFVPFGKNYTTKTGSALKPSIIMKSDLTKSTEQPVSTTNVDPLSPGTNMIGPDKNFNDVHKRPRILGKNRSRTSREVLVFPSNSHNGSVSTTPLAHCKTQQIFPANTEKQSANPSQKTTVIKFIVRKSPPDTLSSSIICNSKTMAANSIVNAESSTNRKPVATLCMQQSHARSSASATTVPGTCLSSAACTTQASISSSFTSPSTTDTSPSLSFASPNTTNVSPVISHTYPSASCSSYTCSAIKPTCVKEESPSVPLLKNTVTALTLSVNTQTEYDNDMPFKISSVFSLCDSDLATFGEFMRHDTQHGESNRSDLNKGEPEMKQNGGQDIIKVNGKEPKISSCKYDKECFPVIEKLKLHGLSTVDVRKLQNFIGRQSCSQKCREKTVERYCRLNKLCINEKPAILDFPLLTDIKMEPEELQQFETFLKTCQPSPRYKKLLLFHHQKQMLSCSVRNKMAPFIAETKPDINQIKKGKKVTLAKKCVLVKRKRKMKRKQKPLEEQNVILNDPAKDGLLFRVPQIMAPVDAKPKHVSPDKAQSVMNPGSNATSSRLPIHLNNIVTKITVTSKHTVPEPFQVTTMPQPLADITSSSKTIKPLLDTTSPAFQKAVSALGTNKFFLLKVQGKNVLMPFKQNTVLPRAFVLGEDTKGVLSEMHSSVTRTKPRTKAVINSSSNTEATYTVKCELLDSGYEVPVTSFDNTLTGPQVAPVRIKQEPTGRGYADEINPKLTSSPDETRKSVSVKTTTFAAKQQDENPIPCSIFKNEYNEPSTSLTGVSKSASSVDRIRKLKELLKKNEEELEMIKKRRLEEAVDVSEMLNDIDM